MFLEVKFTQKLNVRPLVEPTGLLDMQFRQTAVQTDAVRTQLVVLSFGNSTASGGGVPAKHAATHFEGGSDELKPYDIGAALKNGDSEEPFKALKLISPFVSSPEFLAAMLGYGFGGYVDENGESHLWADHIHGRVSFETLEMRYRKLLVSGEDLLVSCGGVVEEVLPYGQTLLSSPDGRLIITQDRRAIYWPSNGRVVFKLKGEPGIDLQQFVEDDILRYTWRDDETGKKGASGWLRVKHCFDTFWYEGEVVSGSPEWLQKGMTAGQMGNYTKKDRQGFINISGRDKQIAIWDEVDGHILKPSMLKVYLGDLRYVTDPDLPEMGGFGLFSINAFLKGVFVLRNGKRVDAEFDRVETEFRILDGKIASKVSKQEFTSLWEQEADAIVSTVSGNGFKSYILQKADRIELTALETLINGLLTVKGLIKADKIDVDNLVARSIDTRVDKQGVQINRGECSVEVYNRDGRKVLVIDDGTTGLPRIELSDTNGVTEVVLDNEKLIKYRGNERTEYGNRIEGWRNMVEGLKLLFSFGEYGITLPNFATVDIPGVTLCLGTASDRGSVLSQWGPVYCVGIRSVEGERHYTITHNLNHTDYHLDVAPYRKGDGSCHFTYAIVSKGTSSVTFAIVFSDSNVPADTYFDFKLCGRNKA